MACISGTRRFCATPCMTATLRMLLWNEASCFRRTANAGPRDAGNSARPVCIGPMAGLQAGTPSPAIPAHRSVARAQRRAPGELSWLSVPHSRRRGLDVLSSSSLAIPHMLADSVRVAPGLGAERLELRGAIARFLAARRGYLGWLAIARACPWHVPHTVTATLGRARVAHRSRRRARELAIARRTGRSQHRGGPDRLKCGHRSVRRDDAHHLSTRTTAAGTARRCRRHFVPSRRNCCPHR